MIFPSFIINLVIFTYLLPVLLPRLISQRIIKSQKNSRIRPASAPLVDFLLIKTPYLVKRLFVDGVIIIQKSFLYKQDCKIFFNDLKYFEKIIKRLV